MILAIDVGNTSMGFVVGEPETFQIIAQVRLSTSESRMPDELAALLLPLFAQKKVDLSKIQGAILCSVVPGVVSSIRTFVQTYLQKPLQIVGEKGCQPFSTSHVCNPKYVGNDRLVTMSAAYKLYGGPALVVDFGTATTFDLMSEEGHFIGGVVAPGAELVGQALSQKAALLPKIEIRKPERVIGHWIVESMNSGVFWGYVGLFEGIIQRMQEEYAARELNIQGPLPVIVTGGYARLFETETKVFTYRDPHLLVKGLFMLYAHHQSNPGI